MARRCCVEKFRSATITESVSVAETDDKILRAMHARDERGNEMIVHVVVRGPDTIADLVQFLLDHLHRVAIREVMADADDFAEVVSAGDGALKDHQAFIVVHLLFSTYWCDATYRD